LKNLREPEYLILETTTECNLKCKHCHQWMTTEGPGALSTSEKIRAIEEFADLNPKGRILLTGGETMHKYEEFMAICLRARELSLDVIANTNGTYINQENMREVLEFGPRFLLFSLDSHIEKLHRYMRGNALNYQHLVSIIPQMVAMRNSESFDTFLYTHTIIFEENIELWEDYISFARQSLHVDSVHFQLLKETLRNQGDKDPFFDKHFFKNPQRAWDIIETIKTKYAEDPIMGMKSYDLELMQLEVFNPQHIELGICNSANKNIYIDSYGQIQLCMNMHEIMPSDTIGHYSKWDLASVWHSIQAADAREIMKSCTKNCGMLNCHRKASHDRA
jgi:MoaA/NifB/PqqE/SkfB family radical SAM enzyme